MVMRNKLRVWDEKGMLKSPRRMGKEGFTSEFQTALEAWDSHQTLRP